MIQISQWSSPPRFEERREEKENEMGVWFLVCCSVNIIISYLKICFLYVFWFFLEQKTLKTKNFAMKCRNIFNNLMLKTSLIANTILKVKFIFATTIGKYSSDYIVWILMIKNNDAS